MRYARQATALLAAKSPIQRNEVIRNMCAAQEDEKFMRRALELAKKGEGWVSPNPMVGAVIVKDGRIIGEGWHEKYGGLHAERNALAHCSQSPRDAVMYVTLEPCCHYGKQPPCTEAILEAGIRKVVVGAGDPNPLVAGRGLEILRQHGIEVQEHVLEEECREINQVFFHYIRTGTPYVVMKYAMTMDGKIAAYTGASKWITGEAARAHVQSLRHKYRGIMAGVGTVLADDPLLTCRMEGGRNPVRIICDTHLSTPLDSRILETAKEADTILAIGEKVERERQIPYEEKGCTLLEIPEKEGKIDLSVLMKELGKRQIDSLLLEGGGELNWSAVQAGIIQKVMAYIAPKIIGGRGAKGPVGGQGYPDPQECLFLKSGKISRLGDDYLIESEVDEDVHRNC